MNTTTGRSMAATTLTKARTGPSIPFPASIPLRSFASPLPTTAPKWGSTPAPPSKWQRNRAPGIFTARRSITSATTHLDANDWFVNRQLWSGLNAQQDCNGNPAGPCNAPKTPLKWNEFGYNLGGPFYIPGHYNTDKSKTFFFWSQSWRRYRQGTVVSGSVPTPLMRQGNFSECDPASPNYNLILVNSGCVL